MTIPAPPPMAIVRVKKNDCNVPVDSEGVVAYIHPESRNPVVMTASGRPVALLPDQLEVISMPATPVRESIVALNGDAKARSEFTWTLFDPRPATVTLSPSSIRLSAGTAEMLNGADRVQLLFDRERGAIALRPASGDGASFKVSTNAYGATISAREFLKLVDFSGVRQGKPLRLVARREELSTGRVIVTGVPFLPS